ncbi:hypothetical protein EJ08DRAFT_596367 [Tothia fuscella]|uniref:Uncharacterized protein n=1 Tax=Tothia fuscella TaxID=1048955 RepID=A0A9P4TUY6_9PEZI|nr:hypothetical protein EJ08DRAFT_596367 [Tothia fuscella]
MSGPPHLPVSSVPTKRSNPFPPGDSPGPPEKKGKWTPEEDKLAIELRRGGMKWDDIAKRLPGRSAISCRLRYQNYSEKRQDWDDEKKNKLARLYNRFKQPMWEMVAKEMGLPWRAIEAIHWQMGPEEMASRANVPVFQAHNAQRSKSPPNPRANPVATPTTPSGILELQPQMQIQPSSASKRRRSSSSGRRRANSAMQSDRPALEVVSEMEAHPAAPTSEPHGYRSDAAVTPGSSVEWNGSPLTRAMPEERIPPEMPQPRSQSNLPPEIQLQRTSSHHRTQSQTSIQSSELLTARGEQP